MRLLLLICIAFFLGISAYQDFKFRGISWYLFPLLTLAITAYNLLEIKMTILLEHIAFNLSFLALQLLLLFIYFRIKNVSIKEFFNRYMGIGDLLFFVVMAVTIGFPIFPLFFIFSLIASLLYSSVFLKNQTIPLAGLQAICLALFIGYQELFMMKNTFNTLSL